jgi:hypothetical protein
MCFAVPGRSQAGLSRVFTQCIYTHNPSHPMTSAATKLCGAGFLKSLAVEIAPTRIMHVTDEQDGVRVGVPRPLQHDRGALRAAQSML